MSIWMFWKLFGDVCLYFSLIGALPTLFYHEFSFLWPALLYGIGGLVSSMLLLRTRHGHRLWGLIFPLLSLLFATDLMSLMILLPPVIYTVVVIIKGEFLLEYLSFREFFRKSCIIWAVIFVILCMGSATEDMTRPWAAVISLEDPLRYGVFFAVSGVILLRQLRLGSDSGSRDRQMNNTQTFFMLCGSGVVVLLMVGAEWLISNYAEAILNTVGQVLMLILSLPVGILGWLLNLIMGDMNTEYGEVPEGTGSTAATETIPEGIPAPAPSIGTVEPQDIAFPWWLAVLILAALTVVLFTAIRLFRSKAKNGASQTVFDKVIPPERKVKQSAASNRAKVRRYYREHLKAERRKGLRLRHNQTSADILEKIAPDTDAQAAARLREIYLKARYDEKAEISPQDALNAKNALRKTKE